VSRCPQVTQKRRPFWFELPQSGQGIIGAAAAEARSTVPRGPKLTCGAGGLWRLAGPASRGEGGDAIGGMAGMTGIGGGGGVDGARAVAASGEASPISPGGASPMGGVGGAMRGASL
jgi:hypothetical protein